MTNAVDRSNPVPLWAQLLEDLRARLAAGEFQGRFPTDKELTATYKVSRHTAREAVRRLTAEGIVQRERGRGTTVLSPEFEQPLGSLYSMFRSVEAQGVEQRSEVLALTTVTDAAAAARLALAPSAKLVYLERIRHAAGIPLALDRVWLPLTVARPLLSTDFARTALYDELHQRCGIVLDRATERIVPVLADAEQCAQLDIDRRQPCFAIERVGSCQQHSIEWRWTLIRGDRFAFVADWGPGASASNAFELTPNDG